ncbi:histidine kinase [Sphingomonas sp. Leaf339]|uniref:sensor histidine kinase n=1 Tax=Sphingomonas sp. Leaf339 TaxID=1736343 RepID=UPI0006F77F81|nr:PAS domain-containing protein [Sphingomonas sp. Leaf339]KQU53001.1 histidine kinase [Sphingomonas sp. Leaf339]
MADIATVDTAMCDDPHTRVLSMYDAQSLKTTGALDDITRFAAALCDAPIALVTLLEEEYQHFVGRTGIDMAGTPRDISFCTHALASPNIMVVADTHRDPRFVDNPLVTAAPFVRFYAGAPLLASDGSALGTLCILDTVPRDGLTPLQQEGLVVLARAAMARLDDRRSSREQGIAEAEQRHALEQSELRFRTLADTMPQMVWSTLPDGFHDYYNARWYDFTGTTPGSTDGEGWNDIFHPDDQARAWTLWRHSLTTGEPYEIEYRLRHFDGTYRWVLGRALPIRDDAGRITRWFGTCTDIHEQKLALEEREIISQELSHRIKNIFAVVAGLIQFAARTRPEFAPIASDLRQRITALGRAHDFVRPHSAQSRPSAQQDSLKGLLDSLFEPYQQQDHSRIQVRGEDLLIDDRSATPLALLFHELATNATKYGALSTTEGTIDVTVEQTDDVVTLIWMERGGPVVVTPPSGLNGFGSQLIELSAVRQLGGQVCRDWQSDGLIATIKVPRPSFSRP